MVVDVQKLIKENKKLKAKQHKTRVSIHFKSKALLKPAQVTYKMPNREVSNIFHDENRFFKGAILND